jgi:hypothetical protein
MPRIYTGSNDPIDFCRYCFPRSEQFAIEKYGEGEGPDDRGNCFDYEADHPPYDGNDYKCAKCGDELYDERDY